MQLFFSFFFLLGLVLVFMPFTPLFAYTLFPPDIGEQAADTLVRRDSAPTNEKSLSIPKIGVALPIFEGDESALEKGAWRIPQTSDDPTRGNMVISAHRFRYRPPSTTTFYLLDKLTPGDDIVLAWNGQLYEYEVTGSSIVDNTAVEVLNATADPTLTLLTCHPLFSTAQRLVVTAQPR